MSSFPFVGLGISDSTPIPKRLITMRNLILLLAIFGSIMGVFLMVSALWLSPQAFKPNPAPHAVPRIVTPTAIYVNLNPLGAN